MQSTARPLAPLASPAGAAANLFATVTAYGYLRAAGEPQTLFYDPFDTALGLDTAVRWSTAGTAPTVVTGALQLASATTASAQSALISRPTFACQGLAFLAIGFTARFEAVNSTPGTAFITGAHRFMGWGVPPATYVAAYSASTTTGPLLNGIGFEIDTDGLMYPVVYDNGTRTRGEISGGGASLNAGRTLADGQLHQFLVVRRADTVFWYVDGTDVPAAVHSYRRTGFSQPDASVLPIRLASVNGTTALTTAPTTRIGAIGIGDTGESSIQIADGVYPWRKSTVSRSAAQQMELLTRQTYSMGLSAMAATNVGVIAVVQGSATKVVRIARVSAVCIAGAATNAVLKIEKLSALAAGTTAASVTGASDTNNAAATAASSGYTAAPTTATTQQYLGQKIATGTVLGFEWNFGDVPEQQPTLRGTAQWFALRNMVAIATSGAWHISIEFTEEIEGA